MNLKTRILGLCALTVSLSAVTAQAFTGDNLPYARVSALLIVPADDSFDDGAGVMVALGTQFGGDYGSAWQHQIEIEVGWGELDLDPAKNPWGATGDLRAIPLLLTYRAVWAPSDTLSIGFGPSIGMNYLKGRIAGLGSDTDWVFSYGLGALASWHINEKISLDVGYRYLWNDDADFGGVVTLTDMEAHLFELGLRFRW